MVNAVECGLGPGLGSGIETQHGGRSFRDVENAEVRLQGSEWRWGSRVIGSHSLLSGVAERVDCEGLALLCVGWQALDTSFGAFETIGCWNRGTRRRTASQVSSYSLHSLLLAMEKREGYMGPTFCDGMCECLISGRPPAAHSSTYVAGVSPPMVGKVRGCWNPICFYQPSHLHWTKDDFVLGSTGAPDGLAASSHTALLGLRSLALANPISPQKVNMGKSFALHRCVQ